MNSKDEWNELDNAAKTNLSRRDFESFLTYKDRIKFEGCEWQYARLLLKSYILDTTELYLHNN